MFKVPNALTVALELLRERQFKQFLKRCAGLIYERRITYGLRRDLQVAFVAPKAKIPITTRAFSEDDVGALFPEDRTILNRKETIEIATRHAHYKAGIDRCYVAVDQRSSQPCYFQWLMGPDQNAKIQAFFPKTWFPVLARNEALLENAYTPPAYRGNGIMPAAMAQIAERAAALQCRYVVTFVDSNNIPSLRGCEKAGFAPYLIRQEDRWLFGTLRFRTFLDLPDSVPGAIYA